MQQPTHSPRWPEVIVSPEVLAAFARYNALSPDERTRAARLVASTGCTIDQACAAVEAQRLEEHTRDES